MIVRNVMTSARRVPRLLPVLAFLVLAFFAFGGTRARAAAAQASVTGTDVQRLQDSVSEVSRDVSQLGSRDAALASRLQAELDDARDEVSYLRVKLRRNEPVAYADYTALRDRIESIRDRARGDAAGASAPAPASRDSRPGPSSGRAPGADAIPAGTEFDVRLQKPLSSGTAQVEDHFEATTVVDLRDQTDHVTVPAGSVMRGVISSVTKATRTERTGKLTVAFDRLTVGDRSYPIRATVEQAIESEGIRGEAGRIGVGAGAGAIIGALLGGGQGALAGILIGGGGTIAATEGKDVELPAGTVLRVRLDSGLSLH